MITTKQDKSMQDKTEGNAKPIHLNWFTKVLVDTTVQAHYMSHDMYLDISSLLYFVVCTIWYSFQCVKFSLSRSLRQRLCFLFSTPYWRCGYVLHETIKQSCLLPCTIDGTVSWYNLSGSYLIRVHILQHRGPSLS